MLSPIPYRKISKQLRTVRTRDAGAEPVSLADYKLYIRQSNLSIPVGVFDAKARASRALVENYIGRSLVSQAFTSTMDLPPGMEWGGSGWTFGSVLARFAGFSPFNLELPRVPLRQVSGVFVTDDNANVITVDPPSYWVSSVAQPARLALRQTAVWPDMLGRSFETFSVQYTAGYSIPFTASGSTLTTAQPHGLINGAVERVWTTSDGTMAAGLEPETDYFVVGATANTLELSATPAGAPISTTDGGEGNLFLGAIPDNYLRALLNTASVDFYPEKKRTSRFDVAEEGALPDTAKTLLHMDRIIPF